MSQADEYRNCSAIVYPGFNAQRPAPPPIQNGKAVSVTAALDSAVVCNMEQLGKRGVGREFHRFVTTDIQLKDFVRDSFWWFFLEYFVSVDFDALLSNVKANTMVSESDMAAFAFEGAVPMFASPGSMASTVSAQFAQSHHLPDIKPNLVDKTGALNKQQQESIDAEIALGLRIPMPPHLCGMHCENRRAEAVAQVGSPRILSAVALATSIHNSNLALTAKPLAGGRSRKPGDAGGGGGSINTPQQSLFGASPSGIISNSNLDTKPTQIFTPRRPSKAQGTAIAGGTSVLRILPPALDSTPSVTDGSSGGAGGGILSAPRSGSRSPPRDDGDCPSDDDDATSSGSSAASSVASALTVSKFPSSSYTLHALPVQARLQVAAKEQHQLFTRMAQNYRQLMMTLLPHVTSLKDGISRFLPEIVAQAMFYLYSKSMPFASKLLGPDFQLGIGRLLSFWMGGVQRDYNVLAWQIHNFLDPTLKKKRRASRHSISHARRKSSKGMSAQAMMSKLTEQVAKIGAQSTRGGFDEMAALSTSTVASDDPLDPVEIRKKALVQQDVSVMADQMAKIRTTHTFSQYHYTGGVTRQATSHANASSDDTSNLPKRIAQSYSVTNGKRNVQVIKKEIDGRFREQLPWYCKADARVTKRDGTSRSTTFSLSNWSPLMHRYMLTGGEDNKAVAKSIFWTVVMPR